MAQFPGTPQSLILYLGFTGVGRGCIDIYYQILEHTPKKSYSKFQIFTLKQNRQLHLALFLKIWQQIYQKYIQTGTWVILSVIVGFWICLLLLQMQKANSSTSNQVQQQIAVGTLPQQVIQFFQSRIQTEQSYARALQKLNNKFPGIETHPNESSRVLKHLKAIHSEKYHQTMQFIVELKEEKNNFQTAIAKSNEELQKSAQQVRVYENNLKNIMDKINKIHSKGQEQLKNIDERFLLKQLNLISGEYRTKRIQDSLKILEEQNKISSNCKKQYEELKVEGQKVIKKIKKHEKIILENSPQIERQIIELVKKYTVQQVSLIRNLQYDIDNMIKKTNIFDQVPPPQQQNTKHPKNLIVKAAKDIFKNQFKIKDVFEETKKYIANLNQASLKSLIISKESEAKNQQQVELTVKNWNQTKNADNLLARLNENYQESKQIGQLFIEYFRNKNINKFPEKQFNQLKKVFNFLFEKYIEQKDLTSLQRLIVYGSCYCKMTENNGPKTTMMDSVNKNQFLGDSYNWKFILYFVIQRSVVECLGVQNQKEMHLKNNVFSALVSNSLNMIGCGIDKYTTKNTVAKMSKSFGLADNQTSDLLKFIESGYQKYEKQKNKK